MAHFTDQGMSPVTALIESTDAHLSHIVETMYSALSDVALGIGMAALTLWIAFYGIQMIIGRTSEVTVYDLAIHVVRIVAVITFATQWPYFQSFFYDLFTNSGNRLAAILLAPQGTDPGLVTTSLDLYYQNAILAANHVDDGAGTLDFPQHLYAWAIRIGGLVVGVYAGFLIILSKLAVAVLLAIAPVMLLFLTFKNTQGFFEGWLRQLVNFAFVPLLVYALLALLLGISSGFSEDLLATTQTTGGKVYAISSFLMVSFISLLVLMQVTSMASSIAGGFSLSSLGKYTQTGAKLYAMHASAYFGAAGAQVVASKIAPLTKRAVPKGNQPPKANVKSAKATQSKVEVKSEQPVKH